MRRTMIAYVVFGALAAAIVLLGAGTVAAAREASATQPVDVAVERFSIQDLSHRDVDRVYYASRFYLAMTWDASAAGQGLRAADHFDVTLPDQMRFPRTAPRGTSTSTARTARPWWRGPTWTRTRRAAGPCG